MNKPIICIDGGGGYDPRFECESWATNKTYVNAVSAAGGIPVLCYDDACAEDMAKECDGLILTGAFVYIPRPELRARGTAVGQPKRVKLDRALYEAFKAAGKPIYGICLGEQYINVYEGGTIKWRFATKEGVEHMLTSHSVKTEPGSVISNIWGDGFFVNSRHSNAIDSLAPTLKATAWSPDGIIEAVEHKELPIWGFQFHPERMRGDMKDPLSGPDSTPLFKFFVDKCLEYRK
jgi:putative glutamine amidotransferase